MEEMTVKDILDSTDRSTFARVQTWLSEHEYAGLKNDKLRCFCSLDDLYQCKGYAGDCVASKSKAYTRKALG